MNLGEGVRAPLPQRRTAPGFLVIFSYVHGKFALTASVSS